MRNAANVNGGELRLDFDATVQHQRPSSPRPLEGTIFDPETPVDFNQNPADGKINTNRFQLTSAYDKELSVGSWGTTLSVTQTHSTRVQGFFNPDSDAASTPDNATGFSQTRDLTEAYFDTHLTRRFGDTVWVTLGAGELYGHAHQGSQTFTYTVPEDGLPDTSGAGIPGDATSLSDWRSFAGLYGQMRWNLTPRLGLLAGLRLNRTDERRTSGTADGSEVQRATTTRLSGSLGANWRVWQDREGDLDDVVLYASYGNTFQPTQIDFGPDVGGPLLRPETELSYEAGVKADGLDGRFSADLSLFWVDFANQAVATSIDNTPSLANGGRERFKGTELELRFRLLQYLTLSANYSYNDARYRDFQTVIDGDSVQLAGNQLLLSPRHLSGFGLIYSGDEGIQASLVTNYVGRRFLDMQNQITAGSYATVDATLGYAFQRYAISVNGYNLSDRREPVLRSELGEGQFYLLPGRRVFLKVSAAL
jgi:outer membrane receptor protein involved in Fe transport